MAIKDPFDDMADKARSALSNPTDDIQQAAGDMQDQVGNLDTGEVDDDLQQGGAAVKDDINRPRQ
jgi:hypothetical protein